MLALGSNARGRAGLLAGLKPQDVFRVIPYTGTGSAQTLATPFAPDFGWLKTRDAAADHKILSSLRGNGRALSPNSTGAEQNDGAATFLPEGLRVSGGLQEYNETGRKLVAWLIKYAPRFCVEVTYTGDGTSGRQIPHGLGVAPGMVIVKNRNDPSAFNMSWYVKHRSLATLQTLRLNTTAAAMTSNPMAYVQVGDASNFIVNADLNITGYNYVAYLFAHDPDPVNGIIQCGSFTTDNTGEPLGLIPLPWRPQFVLVKPSTAIGNWEILDTTRGWVNAVSGGKVLRPNTSEAELSAVRGGPDNFGFYWAGGAASANNVYLAIRAPI